MFDRYNFTAIELRTIRYALATYDPVDTTQAMRERVARLLRLMTYGTRDARRRVVRRASDAAGAPSA